MTRTQTPALPPVATAEADDRQPFTLSLPMATSIGLSPRWVQYSGVSATARAIAEALTDLLTMRTRGDQSPTLDREFLAYAAGLSRSDQTRPFLQELQDIGFLVVFTPGVNPTTGKQRRGPNGRPLPDHFSINLEPPSGYAGPRNLTELHAHFVGDRDAAYQAAKATGKRVRTGNVSIRRSEFDRSEFDRFQDTQAPDTATLGQGLERDPGLLGHAPFSQVSGDTTDVGSGSGAGPRIVGSRPVSRRSAVTQRTLGQLQIDRSSISEREIEGSIEPVPGGAAQPPATGLEESVVAAVRERVRRLPWREWAKVKLGVANYQLMRYDADQVQNAMCVAMARDGITLEQATEVARHALAEAKGPVYVVRAFEPKKLGEWLRRLEAEPLAEDTLSLPGVAKSHASEPKPTKRQVATGSVAAGLDVGGPSKLVLPACSTCDSKEGETYPNARTVTGADGRERRCPDCLPPAA